jgi:hypothetical protein
METETWNMVNCPCNPPLSAVPFRFPFAKLPGCRNMISIRTVGGFVLLEALLVVRTPRDCEACNVTSTLNPHLANRLQSVLLGLLGLIQFVLHSASADHHEAHHSSLGISNLPIEQCSLLAAGCSNPAPLPQSITIGRDLLPLLRIAKASEEIFIP